MVYEGSAWLILDPDSPRGEDLLLLKCKGEEQEESQGCLELGLVLLPALGGADLGTANPQIPVLHLQRMRANALQAWRGREGRIKNKPKHAQHKPPNLIGEK